MVVAADYMSTSQIEFVNRLDERQECPICKNVFIEPWQTSCGHRFCRNCFEGLFRLGNPKCPIDGEPISRDESFRYRCCEREVLNLQCFCRYKEGSCDWKGEFRHLKAHEESCQYGDGQCAACDEIMERRHLKRHRENECVNRAVASTYCGGEVRQSNMKGNAERLGQHTKSSVESHRDMMNYSAHEQNKEDKEMEEKVSRLENEKRTLERRLDRAEHQLTLHGTQLSEQGFQMQRLVAVVKRISGLSCTRNETKLAQEFFNIDHSEQ